MSDRFPPAVYAAIGELDTIPDLTQLTVEQAHGRWIVYAKRNNRVVRRIEVPA